MSNSANYPSILGFAVASLISPQHQTELIRMGQTLWSFRSWGLDSSVYRSILDSINPADYRRAAQEIKDLVWSSYRTNGAPDRMRVAKRTLKDHPDLAFLFCFDGNGYVRERALKRMQGPLRNPFEVISVMDACNNWVDEVRKQAMDATKRCFGDTSPDVLAAAYPFLQENLGYWRRWHPDEYKRAIELFVTEEVMAAFALNLTAGLVGRPSKVFSLALQYPSIDRFLPNIFASAQQASVRAVALKTMLYRRAVWKIGHKFTWVDKSLGVKRKEPEFASRKLQITSDTAALLTNALKDKHTAVRKVAAQALIDLKTEINIPVRPLAEQLLTDKSSAVRSRGEYLTRIASEE
ncbi:MAG: HEAT repeat domain-containing protein [Pseudomonadota bacterium]